jgi:hypothetical protein
LQGGYDHGMQQNGCRNWWRFTLVAFVFSAIMPFFALYGGQIAHADSAQLQSLYGEKVFICTEQGFEWVKVADLQHGNHAPKPNSHFKCALCFVGAKGAKHTQLAPIELALGNVHAKTALREHFAYNHPVTHGLSHRPSVPRAPPVDMI